MEEEFEEREQLLLKEKENFERQQEMSRQALDADRRRANRQHDERRRDLIRGNPSREFEEDRRQSSPEARERGAKRNRSSSSRERRVSPPRSRQPRDRYHTMQRVSPHRGDRAPSHTAPQRQSNSSRFPSYDRSRQNSKDNFKRNRRN